METLRAAKESGKHEEVKLIWVKPSVKEINLCNNTAGGDAAAEEGSTLMMAS